MKKSLSQKEIEDISLEKGIDPAFIEKDWFAVQLLALLNEHLFDHEVQMVFSGGTSLSKGYDLIKRFSEDLDFILSSPAEQPLQRSKRSAYRKSILEFISTDKRFLIDKEDVVVGDNARFFKSPIVYEQLFKEGSLRPYLQLEMSFRVPRLSIENRAIQSIASAVMGDAPETSILCISPLETAGDKLSALSWRVVICDRSSGNYDPIIIRHLHDLAAMELVIVKDKKSFAETANQSLDQDKSSRGGQVIRDLSVMDRLAQAVKLLKEDRLYREEYEQYVLNMSYAEEDQKIDFYSACSAFERIINVC